jgi:hypothetical protein
MGESSMAGICERSMIGIGEDSISHVVGSRTVIGSGGQSPERQSHIGESDLKSAAAI